MSKEKIKKNVDKEFKKWGEPPYKSYRTVDEKKYFTHIIGGNFKDSPEDKAIKELEKNTGFGFIANGKIINKRLNKPINKEEIITSFNPIIRKMYQELIKILPDKINYNLLSCDFENKKMKIYEDFVKRTGEYKLKREGSVFHGGMK